MTDDPLDRILSSDRGIAPSSGFVSSVMETVQREASVPPPIPFPLLRALPGIGAYVVALIAVAVMLWHTAAAPVETTSLESPMAIGIAWAGAGLLAGWALLKISMLTAAFVTIRSTHMRRPTVSE